MRLNRVGITGGAIYLALGLLWVGFAQPPAATWALVGWFVLVAAVECFIPGEANQVSLARAHLAAPALVYALASMFGPLAVALAVAGLTDLVDGVLLGAVALGLAFGGVVPLWLAIVIIARYLVPAIGGLVLITMHRRPELRHTVSGQVSTSLIIVLVGGICLFRFMNQDVTNVVIGAEIAIPIATLATFVHLGWAARRPVAAPEPG